MIEKYDNEPLVGYIFNHNKGFVVLKSSTGVYRTYRIDGHYGISVIHPHSQVRYEKELIDFMNRIPIKKDIPKTKMAITLLEFLNKYIKSHNFTSSIRELKV